MPSKVGEVRWERAKQIVRRQYPKIDPLSERFWSLVSAVYQRIADKAQEPTYVIKAGKDSKEFSSPSPVRQWEPPGGTHPKTFRSRVGDKYIYRPASEGEQRRTEGAADLYSGKQLSDIRAKYRGMSPDQHRQEADKAKSKVMHDVHNYHAQQKEDLEKLKSRGKNGSDGRDKKKKTLPKVQRKERKSERARPTPTGDKMRDGWKRERN